MFLKGQVILKTGDRVPDVSIRPVLHYTDSVIRLSSMHKKKLVLLDFWSTWCGSCIQAFPKMDSLQQFFGESLLILPVTWQKETQIEAFWKKNAITKNIHLPTVTDDTLLTRFFQDYTLPCVIWLDGNGTIKAVTNETYVNKKINLTVFDGGKRWLKRRQFPKMEM